MTELLTAAQMRAAELAAIATGAVTGLELIERAGSGVVSAILAEWPDLAAGSFRALVLCGPGNNGGDGFVVARLLRQWGWEVAVCLFGDADRLPPDAQTNCQRWARIGGISAVVPDGDFDVIVDALFGTGLTRALSPDLLAALSKVFDQAAMPRPAGGPRIVAVDIPSGICADSGRALGHHVPDDTPMFAHLTVTFHRPKLGHVLGQGGERSGALRCVDIGLVEGQGAIRLTGVMAALLAKTSGHKFGYGHALVLSGGPGKGGAARLTARGALRIGAGLITLGVPPAALQENAARLDAIMLARIEDGEALAGLLADERINALCLGPGLGIGDRATVLVAAALEGGPAGGGSHYRHRPTVLDADALTVLANNAALFARLHDRVVLTPHGGEFARLFPDIAEQLAAPAFHGPAYSKVDATRDAAKRSGCVVVYKGADTVIADPMGRCSVNSAHYDRAAPWLATAGSGDVLAGFITGLLARGYDPMLAAETGAWLHVECARSFGPGLTAEDIPQELPKIFRALGL